MEPTKINLVYFSPTYSTQKISRLIATRISSSIKEYDITQASPIENIVCGENDLLIVGMPVYAGRIPAKGAEALQRFQGTGTPAIVVCIYGNRDYDDALLEMKNIVTENGFKVVSAAAFIARHSIFPEIATNRPDEQDIRLINEFADKSAGILRSANGYQTLPDLAIKGSYPYKVPGKLPLQPKGSRKCIDCGKCIKSCPVQAIPVDNPRKTIQEKCITCVRCIVVCPVQARHFGGFIYKIAKRKFIKAYSLRKEPDMFYMPD